MGKVLVVEGDHLLRWSLEKLLSRDGHTVHTVEPGGANGEGVRTGEYRVIIKGYGTVESDGFREIRWIKAQNPQTHVIIIAAMATPQNERLARDTGAFDFFDKPFELAALRQAVERAIGTPERRKGPRCCADGCLWLGPCDELSRVPRRRTA
jgi:DNA-binding NtrC family response regulator